MGRSHRKIVISNAAHAVVNSLERVGITCILVHDMATYLLGGEVIPKVVKVVIMPSVSGTLLKEEVAAFLVQDDPIKFRIRNRMKKAPGPVLSYYDDTVKPPKKTWCYLELISVQNPPPPEYTEEHIARVDGLAVGSMLPTLIDGLRSLLEEDKFNYFTIPNWEPSNRMYNKVKLLLGRSSCIIWSHGHESFRQEALQCLQDASLVFPECSAQFSSLIKSCQKASRMHETGETLTQILKNVVMNLDLAVENEQQKRVASGKDITNDIFPVSVEEKEDDDEDSDPFPLTPPPPPPATKTMRVPLRTEVVSGNDITHDKFPVSVEEDDEEESDLFSLAPPPPTKTMRVPLRTEVICLIAKKVVDILNEIGCNCALFGSLACYLYGNARSPNDIDLVTFPPSGRLMDAEWLKQEIAGRDSDHFSLERPKDPTATYRVLYFVVDRGLAPNNTFHKNKCKIDVLIPGTMHLPSLSGPSIKWQGGLPVVPFPVLLLQKLQGWDDHMHMVEPYKFEKHVTDASDVQALLKLEHVVSLRFSQPWMDRMLFSQKFMDLSVERVKDFCDMYPDSRSEWFRLGFGVY